MSQLVFIKKLIPQNPKIEIGDVGKILEVNKNNFKIDFLRINKSYVIDRIYFQFINIATVGDRFEYKICDRCFKFLKTEQMFENNRLKKGDVITKRPSCRDCRKIKNGVSISAADKRKWKQIKPKEGEIFICPICNKKSIGGISKHVLDHNHSTGRVRGYLCESCNTGIGRFDDDISIVENAINWLKNQNI